MAISRKDVEAVLKKYVVPQIVDRLFRDPQAVGKLQKQDGLAVYHWLEAQGFTISSALDRWLGDDRGPKP